MSDFREKYLRDIWNVPNVLTMLRLALVPVFAALLLCGRDKAALACFLLASGTDWLDGYLARRNHQITAFGKLMDPLADKLMVCTALILQGLRGIFPWLAIGIVMAKELLMVAGGVYLLNQDVVVYSKLLGKAAQVSFIAALTLSFWYAELADLAFPVDRLLLWLAVLLALGAMVDYGVSAIRTIRALKRNG